MVEAQGKSPTERIREYVNNHPDLIEPEEAKREHIEIKSSEIVLHVSQSVEAFLQTQQSAEGESSKTPEGDTMKNVKLSEIVIDDSIPLKKSRKKGGHRR
ncbi:MAG: hypothetical protein WC651_04835 [Candidatus Gracilibacteria bacterium]|jgi:hypothetical protein